MPTFRLLFCRLMGQELDFRLFARSKIFSYFIRYLFFWSSRGKLFIFFDLKTFQYLPSQAPLWGIRRTECSLLQVNCGCQSVNGWSDHDFFLCRLDLNYCCRCCDGLESSEREVMERSKSAHGKFLSGLYNLWKLLTLWKIWKCWEMSSSGISNNHRGLIDSQPFHGN